jgi:hypothetical protein
LHFGLQIWRAAGAVFEGFPSGFLMFQQNGLSAPEVDVGGREVSRAIVKALVIIMADEVGDRRVEIARQEVGSGPIK